MVVTTYRIPYTYGETIRIHALFDTHYGNRACDIRAFKSFIADDKEAYWLTGGDNQDSITITDKRYRKTMDVTESESIIDEQVDGMTSMLMPYKDRGILIGSGNHEQKIARISGTHPAKRLAKNLGVPYLGYTWYLRLILTENGARGRTVTVLGHHGFGGGSRTRGGSLTKYTNHSSYFDGDVYLYGHDHKRQRDEIDRIGLAGDKIISKPKVLCLCGTYLKTFSDTVDPTYSEEFGHPPTAIGNLTLNIKPTRKWVEIRVEK